MKLGLQGITILVESGDFGAAGFPDDSSPSGCLGKDETIYNPDYPSNCPYLTSVGATQLQLSQSATDPESAMQTALPGAPNFASGGGFSNYFPAPDYQSKALDTYFSKHDPGHPTYIANDDATNVGENGGLYNRAGRGFPDVSANGARYAMYNDGDLVHFFGSSLAAPLWAAVVTLLNEQRQAKRKSSIGFLNPVLYANPGILTDIKNGSNPGCGTSGFQAVEGWDPITGLGTPNFPKMSELFLSLP
jgi:tripeptidyl-peptidase-1